MNTFVTLKTKRWFRIVLLVLKIFLVIGIIGLVFHVILNSPNLWDIKTVDDADLQLEKITPRENENAANFLPVIQKATEAEFEILDNIPQYENGQFYKWINRPLSEKEIMSAVELEEYITESKPLVEKFVAASKKSYYHCPYDVYAYPRQDACYLGSVGGFSTLAALHARYALSINDINRAQMLVTSLLNVGQLITEQKSPFGVIDFLIGKRNLDIAIDIIESNQTLQRIFQHSIKKYSLPSDVLSRPMMAEYHFFKSAINNKEVMVEEGFGEFTKNSSYSWRPNTTANIYAEYIRTSIAAFETPCDVEPVYSKLEAFRGEFRKESDSLAVDSNSISNAYSFLKLNIKPNIIGGLALSQVLQDLSNLRDEKCDLNERIEKLSNPG